MQEFQVFNWEAMAARIKSKRILLYIVIPITFICSWGLTFAVKNYYICTVSLAPEEPRAAESNRVLTLNRPENYDLGIVQTMSGISHEDYDQVLSSTAFLCEVLTTPVMTADSTFIGTYYSYLVSQYAYPLHKRIIRFFRGQKSAQAEDILPPLDAFYPQGYAKEAIALAQKHISCEISRRTALTTITIEAQDPLVAAMVAQAVIYHLEQFITDVHLGKMKVMHNNLQDYIHRTYLRYQEALEQGDETRAEMLLDACNSFDRQAIILSGQMQCYHMFSILKNPSVPMRKAGPHHILFALILTMLLSALALLWICRRELFGINEA